MQVLLTNPEVDTLTYYLAAWTKQLLKKCKFNNKYYHLRREKANRPHFESMLKKRPIDLLLLCGHGGSDRVYGHDGVILDNENISLARGKIVHALSCQSAKKLGVSARHEGVSAYIGYKEDFIAFLDQSKRISRPLQDATAALFLDAAFTAPKELLRGVSPEEAVAAARKSYDNSIKKALNSDVQSDDGQFINWLYWDRDNLTLC